MANVESEAVFKARALQIGITQPQVDVMIAAGFSTMGAFSFGSGFQPGQADETSLIDFFAKIFPGAALTDGLKARLRRLYYESHTMVLADMKSRIERTDTDAPKKMQAPERAQRLLDQKNRLIGLNIQGELEPSYALIDKVQDQFEHNELRYIPVEELTTRQQELMGDKKDQQLAEVFKKNKQGVLTATQEPKELKADTSTDLKLRNALVRRCLAYDQCSLIDYDIQERWICKLFERMSEEPPPGYRAVTMDQALQADKKLWIRMAEECRSGIAVTPGTPRPLNLAMLKYCDHPDVNSLLQPLPDGAKSAGASSATGKRKPWQWNQKNPESDAAGSSSKTTSKGKGRGTKGKGKGKGKQRGVKGGRPENCVAWTADGRMVCYGYNCRNGCPNPVTNGRCVKGWHICGWAPCHGSHPMFSCTWTASAGPA